MSNFCWRCDLRQFDLKKGVQLVDLQPIGPELAVKWADGAEHFISLEALRKACPCANCAGEMDVMGNMAKGPPPNYTTESFQVRRLNPVGGYAVQIVWQDNHDAGLYSLESLREIGDQSAG